MKYYRYNNKLAITASTIVFIVLLFFLLWALRNHGIASRVFMTVLLAFGWLYILFKTLKRIEFRFTANGLASKEGIEILWEDIVRIEHYKKGPLTERIYIITSQTIRTKVKKVEYTQNIRYEIEWDLKEFPQFCEDLYNNVYRYVYLNRKQGELSKGYDCYGAIFDKWFQEKFGDQ